MAYVNIPNEHHAVGGVQGKSLNNSTMFGVCVYMMCILDIIFSSYSIHCIRSIHVYTVFALQISVVTFWYTPQKTNMDTPNPHSFPGKILFQTIIFRFNFCDLHGTWSQIWSVNFQLVGQLDTHRSWGYNSRHPGPSSAWLKTYAPWISDDRPGRTRGVFRGWRCFKMHADASS